MSGQAIEQQVPRHVLVEILSTYTTVIKQQLSSNPLLILSQFYHHLPGIAHRYPYHVQDRHTLDGFFFLPIQDEVHTEALVLRAPRVQEIELEVIFAA